MPIRREAHVGSIVIVSGCPGSGKTTLSRTLAESNELGLHLVSDVFYEFIPNVIDPATPASRQQNIAIMRALGASAAEFVRGGYKVVLDGVIGPWMLPELRPFLEPLGGVQFVVLDVSLNEALARVASRQGSDLSGVVRRMHGQFDRLGALEPYRVDASTSTPDQLARSLAIQLSEQRMVLDWSLVPT